MKRIIYTCDRCGKEIDADRYHITICKEIPAGEPELIGNSADRDYCYDCMVNVSVYMSVMPKNSNEPHGNPEEIAPEETITTYVPPDPEDMEEPEESVMCELREMDAEQRKRRKWLKPETRDKIIELYNNGANATDISLVLGVDKKNVYNVVQRAKEKGLIKR